MGSQWPPHQLLPQRQQPTLPPPAEEQNTLHSRVATGLFKFYFEYFKHHKLAKKHHLTFMKRLDMYIPIWKYLENFVPGPWLFRFSFKGIDAVLKGLNM